MQLLVSKVVVLFVLAGIVTCAVEDIELCNRDVAVVLLKLDDDERTEVDDTVDFTELGRLVMELLLLDMTANFEEVVLTTDEDLLVDTAKLEDVETTKVFEDADEGDNL